MTGWGWSYLARISHGQRAHPPKNAQIICPRLMLMYLGMSTVISLAALREFAELQQSAVINMIAAAEEEMKGRTHMFVPRVARAKEKDMKNAAGLFVH